MTTSTHKMIQGGSKMRKNNEPDASQNTWERDRLAQQERDRRAAIIKAESDRDRIQKLQDYKDKLRDNISHLSVNNLPFRGNVPYKMYEDIVANSPVEILVPLLHTLMQDVDQIVSELGTRYPTIQFQRKLERKIDRGLNMNGRTR